MRTTVNFDDDTAAEVRRLRREEQRGLSEAVNELIRRGMAAGRAADPFVPRTHRMGVTIDVSNVADVLDLVEGRWHNPVAR